MKKGGAFLTTPFGVDEIFTREKWSDDQKEFFEAIRDFAAEAVAPHAEDIEKLEQIRALEHGYKILTVVTDYDSPEVDLPEDIPWVEKYIESHRKVLQIDTLY